MNIEDQGGPAFPGKFGRDGSPVIQVGRDVFQHGGMALRDWFAGQALAGILANTDRSGSNEAYARDSFALADAMLKERERK